MLRWLGLLGFKLGGYEVLSSRLLVARGGKKCLVGWVRFLFVVC